MENLERTWFKCQTCGIECSNEVKAQYEDPYDDKLYTWDECTTCAMVCDDCDGFVERDSGTSFAHSKHFSCWATYCPEQETWLDACPDCQECPVCDHCPHCERCWYKCTC